MQDGLFAWMKRNLRGRNGQKGFTLIELLVVVTILGILAGIVTLSLVGLTNNANTQSCRTEYKTVQAALDAYMAQKQVFSVPIPGSPTNDMTTPVALYNANPTDLLPNFTRNGKTQYLYMWEASGRITSTSGPCQSAIQ